MTKQELERRAEELMEGCGLAVLAGSKQGRTQSIRDILTLIADALEEAVGKTEKYNLYHSVADTGRVTGRNEIRQQILTYAQSLREGE